LPGFLALATLLVMRRRRPASATALAALCLVGGHPGYSTGDAERSGPRRGAVLGILRLSTCTISTLIAGDRSNPVYWLATLSGGTLVIGFTWHENGSLLGQRTSFCSPATPRIAEKSPKVLRLSLLSLQNRYKYIFICSSEIWLCPILRLHRWI
jgi:hypothetical protein